MYIWVGIDVDGQLAEMRERAAEAEHKLGLEISCYTLPMHVSLKISFPISPDRSESVIRDLEDYFSAQSAFAIPVRGVENEGCIVWIRMNRTAELDRLHDELNAMLLDRYGIPLHEYDSDYKFHTTLFMGADEDKLREAERLVANVKLPRELSACRFVVGTSESGALGTYSVLKTICV